MVRKLQDLRQQIDGMPVDSEDVTPLLEQLAGMQMECKSLDGVVGLLAAEKSRIRELLSPPPPAPKDQQQSEEVTA
ncbi:MAG: hypothetical protein JXA20_05510 [Spirochaetes bacterium]|nr:hypothetical protein [Spirochaetota bacterium]